MESTSGGSSSNNENHNDPDVFVDDFYFSALFDDDQVFPISDEKYALELHLQEALISSTISFKIPENQAANNHQTHIHRTLTKRVKVIGESSQSQCFCTICMDVKNNEDMFSTNTCTHTFCTDCITKYVATKIQENISMVKCPGLNCKATLEPEVCRDFVPEEVFDRWGNALCESMVMGWQKFFCPFKDCSAMMVDDGGERVTSSECPNCRRLFCAQCKVAWHGGMTCREFGKMEGSEREEKMVMELVKTNKWRKCPSCSFYVEKISGCLHISCRCGFQFCYGCGSSWSQIHYCCR